MERSESRTSELEEVASRYQALSNQTEIANSVLLLELAKLGEEGVNKAIEKIDTLDNNFQKDTALFILANALYRDADDLRLAKQVGERLHDESEKARLQIHLQNLAAEKGDDEAIANLKGAEKIVNIGSTSDNEIERMLSNFSDTPIEIDGKRFAGVEAFWHFIKLPDDDPLKEEIVNMDGLSAKRAFNKWSRKKKDSGLVSIDEINYHGENIKLFDQDPKEIKKRAEIMEQALRAKFDQNPDAKQALLATGESTITHVLYNKDGSMRPDSKTIPSRIFCGILMKLREEYQDSIKV